MNVLLDTCIIIDALQKRKPFYKYAETIFLDAALNKHKFFVAANSITDIYYLMRKYIHSDKETRNTISKLLKYVNVLDIKNVDIVQALNSEGKDFEDDVLIQCAERNGVDCIVTRNKKDFLTDSIKILSPKEYTIL